MLEEDLDQGIKNLMRLTVESGAPNCNRLNETLRTLPHLLLNTKTLAYELSRLKSVIDQAQHGHPELGHYGLTTKLCTARIWRAVGRPTGFGNCASRLSIMVRMVTKNADGL